MATMPPLIRSISQAGDAKVGLNFLSVAPPQAVTGAQAKSMGIVGHWPWGPQGTTVRCASFADFRASFYPKAFGAIDATTYPAMRAFLAAINIPGPFYVTRIDPTGTADSAALNTYTVTGGTVLGTATYAGSLGLLIVATWAAATDADSTHRNLTISIGTTYSKLYENVTLVTILTLGDPYITWSFGGSPSVLPAAAATATQSQGVHGVAVAGDYVGSSSSNVGIRRFYTQTVDCLFVAECPSAILNTVNTGLVAYGTGSGKDGSYVLCSVASQTVAAAVTYSASYRDTTSKGWMVWPRLVVTNSYDSTFPSVTVDGNAAAAAAIAGADAWLSPKWTTSTPYLTAITDLETNDFVDGTVDALKAVGVSCFYLEPTIGPMLAQSVTTNIVSGQTEHKRTAYTRYFNAKVATISPLYNGLPLDVDLTGQTLGPLSGGFVGAITSFLQNEWQLGHIATVNGAPGFTVDPYGSNTQGGLDAGTFVVAVAIKLWGDMDVIIVTAQIGSTVSIPS